MKSHGPATILDVLEDDILTGALRCISHRKGSPGIDGIRGEELPAYWRDHEETIRKRLLQGIYRPQPVFAIKIPKPDAKEYRRIEIPCVVDRMLQTAMLAVLRPCFEPAFLPSSYAFRKNGGCHRALDTCLLELKHGSSWIIDLDIRHFFDKVDHDILLTIIRRTIRDKRLLHLITAYIKVDIRYRHVTCRKRRGLSQGGPLSPLLANIYLNELDLFLSKIGAHYSTSIFCKADAWRMPVRLPCHPVIHALAARTSSHSFRHGTLRTWNPRGREEHDIQPARGFFENEIRALFPGRITGNAGSIRQFGARAEDCDLPSSAPPQAGFFRF